MRSIVEFVYVSISAVILVSVSLRGVDVPVSSRASAGN